MAKLFWSDTYQDIQSMALCKPHHKLVYLTLDLVREYTLGDPCDDDCECCEDSSLLDTILLRQAALEGE